MSIARDDNDSVAFLLCHPRPCHDPLPDAMPKASSALRMRRPGPLKELPLDSFLSPDPNLPQRPNKRSHSPSPSLFSPTKRRILAEEPIIVGGGSVRSPARLRALPVSRDRGSESPVKKHDGGPHKNSVA